MVAGDPDGYAGDRRRALIAYGTPNYLIRQALERGQAQGYLSSTEQRKLADSLEPRMSDERIASRFAELLKALNPKPSNPHRLAF